MSSAINVGMAHFRSVGTLVVHSRTSFLRAVFFAISFWPSAAVREFSFVQDELPWSQLEQKTALLQADLLNSMKADSAPRAQANLLHRIENNQAALAQADLFGRMRTDSELHMATEQNDAHAALNSRLGGHADSALHPSELANMSVPSPHADSLENNSNSSHADAIPAMRSIAHEVKFRPTSKHLIMYVMCPFCMMILASGFMWFTQMRRRKTRSKDGTEALFAKGMCRLRFKDEILEHAFREECTDQAFKIGKAMVCLASFLLFATQVVRSSKDRAFILCTSGAGWISWGLESCMLFFTCLLSVSTLKMRSNALFLGLVVFLSVYIVFGAIPPFRISCHELATNPMCKVVRPRAVQVMDCSLQGMTKQQEIVTGILLMPWMLPRYEMMHFVWIWIFFVFLGSTFAYRQLTQQTYFSEAHIAVSVLILSLSQVVATVIKYNLEKSHRTRFACDLKERVASKRLFEILEYMMPAHIIRPIIKRPGEPIADPVDRVTVLFISIDGFDDLVATRSPQELLSFLNDKFSLMDSICDTNSVLKVETVGEEYVACVGVVPADVEEAENEGHGPALARLFRAADQILKLQSDEVKLKMGMQTGNIVAGVIGQKLPRFRLFGDTINTAARMMQKGVPGKVQFGEATHKDLPAHVNADYHGEIDMKGKGKVKTWTFPAGAEAPSQNVVAPRRSAGRSSIVEECLAPLEATTSDLTRIGIVAAILNTTGMNTSFKAGKPRERIATTEQAVLFEDVLQEMSGFGVVRRDSELPQKVFTSFAGVQDFEREMEDRWTLRYHEDTVCNGLLFRIDMQAVTFSVFTLVEVVYLVATEAWTTSPCHVPSGLGQGILCEGMVSPENRLSIFLGCRVLIFCIVMLWRWAASHQASIVSRPTIVQVLMVISLCVVGFVLFVSYDMLTTNQDTFADNWWIWGRRPEQKLKVPFDQNFMLLFVLSFYVLITVNTYRFYQSILLIFLAVVLVKNSFNIHGYGVVFFSEEGRNLFIANVVVGTFLARISEFTSRARFVAVNGMEVTQQRIDSILFTLMPPLVLQQLRAQPRASLSHTYDKACIAQSDLCGFTKLSSTRTPKEVVGFVSELFGRFDKLTDIYEVYKVETIGDAYIAGMAERPLTSKNRPLNVLLFGLEMIRATDAWAKGMGVKVACRVGIHYGTCVGGIVGTGMQRYHLFGHFMRALDTLEATSKEGVAQISNACKEELTKALEGDDRVPEDVFGSFVERKEPHLQTSKGEVHEYEEVGGVTYLIEMKELE